jgi:hypothetical protein
MLAFPCYCKWTKDTCLEVFNLQAQTVQVPHMTNVGQSHQVPLKVENWPKRYVVSLRTNKQTNKHVFTGTQRIANGKPDG